MLNQLTSASASKVYPCLTSLFTNVTKFLKPPASYEYEVQSMRNTWHCLACWVNTGRQERSAHTADSAPRSRQFARRGHGSSPALCTAAADYCHHCRHHWRLSTLHQHHRHMSQRSDELRSWICINQTTGSIFPTLTWKQWLQPIRVHFNQSQA